MTAKAALAAERREGTGKSGTRKLRAAGRTPAVIYGHGEQTRLLSVDSHEVALLFSRISVENTIVHLKVAGERGELRSLVREVQVHPASRRILHVDFYQIHAGERVEVSVPVRLVGTPAGVRAGGVLHPNVNDLQLRVDVEHIPEAIDVDVSALEVGDSIHVRDIAPPTGAEILLDGDVTICSVTPPTVTAVPEAEAEAEERAPGTSEPEVIRRRAEEEA
ncbi:MAG TPA: 50S ribosomal protein L25 [Longimicrobiales bacterium]|nr:50S ribosomal protein L25 [Longimicrobiales bacterium]